MIVLMVALGAAVGAPARYVTDRAVQARHATAFPWGTFAVNVAASIALGVIIGAAPSSRWQALLATGFCATLSTFSTFSLETVRLYESGRRALAVGYVGASVLAALGAVSFGFVLGTSL